jgi:hypothetical protein
MAFLNGEAQGTRARRAPTTGLSPLYQWLLKRRTQPVLIVVALACASRLLVLPAPAQTNEYQVKAAFLYNFAKFVEWPQEAFAQPDAPIVLGVLGEEPFGGALDQVIKGKAVNGHPLAIKRLKWGGKLRECHILFICASERKRLPAIFEQIKGAGILTVGETEAFTQQGGIINFTLVDNKVRFEINTDMAEQARLKISSRLLALAKGVITERQAGRY